MIGSRVLGASHADDAFNLAFLLPNIFRRLFAEGAFSSGFVPLFSRRLASGRPLEDAVRFSNEILAVFMPILIIVTILFEIAMPGFLLLSRQGTRRYRASSPSVGFPRWTFPYLIFISLVALLSGVLNSLTRFVVAAFAPALLNIALIVALLLAPPDNVSSSPVHGHRGPARGHRAVRMCWMTPRRAGVHLHFCRRGMTPAVKELMILILPATTAAGGYHISQLFYAYFATLLGEGSFVYSEPCRPPEPAAARARRHSRSAPRSSPPSAGTRPRAGRRRGGRAGPRFDLAMLLTMPATIALAVGAVPIIGALFEGGAYTVEAARRPRRWCFRSSSPACPPMSSSRSSRPASTPART